MSKNTQLGNLVNGIFVDSTGRVGVGTTTPYGQLTIQSIGSNLGGVNFSEGANASTRRWQVRTDIDAFGDFGIRQTTTQTGETFANRLYINPSGNIGIGTSSPNERLHVSGNISVVSSSGTRIGFNTSDQFSALGTSIPQYGIGYGWSTQPLGLSGYYGVAFFSESSERMRITSGGNVGIGTGAPLYKTHIVNGGGNAFLGISNQGVSNGDRQIRIGFGGGGSDTFAQIQGTRYNIADDINISMQAGGGNVYIGLTSSGSNKFAVSAGGVTSDLYINSSGGVGSFTFGTGPVYASGGILTMTNPSDKRLKKDIKEISYGLSDILKLKPVSYNWLNDSINQGIQFGFIAQEVQEIMPDAIKEFGDDIKYLGLEKDAIYVTLVKAIQELSAEINILKNK
jgi:hypothetical protein